MKDIKYTIAFLCSNYSFGGLEMNTVRLASYLSERGWHVKFFALKNSPAARYASEKQIPLVYIKKHLKYFDWYHGFALYKKIKAHQITHLFVRNNRDLSIMAFIKTLLQNRISTFYYQGMQISFDKKDLLHTARFKKADVWIAPSAFLAEQVKMHTNYPEHNIRIIPLGTDTGRFKEALPDQKEARKVLGLPQNEVIAGMLGRLDPLKNQEVMLNALQICMSKGKSLILLITGEPTKNEGNAYEQYLKHQIQVLGLKDKVIFKPFLKKTEYFYAAIDLFILSSLSEPFGLVTIEAMTAGVPVIGTNNGSTPELLQYGNYGHLFAPDDSEQIATHIVNYMTRPDVFKEKAVKGQNFALKHFNKETTVINLENLIKETAKNT